MRSKARPDIGDVIGRIPYRMAFAGGWIDQPFVSKHNPSPPGSMVVVALAVIPPKNISILDFRFLVTDNLALERSLMSHIFDY